MGDEASPTSTGSGPPPPVPAPPATATTCANHPGRTAIGRCPTCRRLVCDECHVRIDGILHCSQCLRATAHAIERGRSPWVGRVATGVAALLVGLVALAAVRGALSTAGFLGGRGTRYFASEFERGVGARR